MKTILPQQAARDDRAVIIDVRTAAEYEHLHVPGSILEPLSELEESRMREVAGGKPVYLLCQSGARARHAWKKLSAAGISDIAVVEGGIQDWEAAGLPVVRGRATISLERQVRLVAGLLVLTGLILGATIHSAFLGISAFIGTGLVFSGITGWCGMGILLSKMPWNTRGKSNECGCATSKGGQYV